MYLVLNLRFYKFFSNYNEIWSFKWFIGSLSESIFLVFLINLVFLMYPRQENLEKSGIQPEFDEYSHDRKSEDFKIIELN